jgi:hypothetical protein
MRWSRLGWPCGFALRVDACMPMPACRCSAPCPIHTKEIKTHRHTTIIMEDTQDTTTLHCAHCISLHCPRNSPTPPPKEDTPTHTYTTTTTTTNETQTQTHIRIQTHTDLLGSCVTTSPPLDDSLAECSVMGYEPPVRGNCASEK